MAIIEQSCRENEIDPEWIKEHFLKVYNARRNEGELNDKAINKILKKAIKQI